MCGHASENIKKAKKLLFVSKNFFSAFCLLFSCVTKKSSFFAEHGNKIETFHHQRARERVSEIDDWNVVHMRARTPVKGREGNKLQTLDDESVGVVGGGRV